MPITVVVAPASEYKISPLVNIVGFATVCTKTFIVVGSLHKPLSLKLVLIEAENKVIGGTIMSSVLFLNIFFFKIIHSLHFCISK